MRADRPLVAAFGLPVLLLLTLLAYRPVTGLGFFLLDDPLYVQQNAHVAAGLKLSTVTWALRSFDAANWHPLTWLSHALDVQLFGLWAGGHHLTNLALHVLNVALLFFAVRGLSGAPWRSLGVAAIFALHPMNVESVAWIAERKNVLSGTCFLATLLAYTAYARRPSVARYTLVTLAFIAGLLAKPMLVTVPFVLLLLDVWPLARWQPPLRRRVIVEKLPWVALSAASSWVTLHAQSSGGAVVTLQEQGVADRVCVATVGYFEYVKMLAWPQGLAIFVPVPRSPCQDLPVPAAALTMLLLSGAALWALRSRLPIAIGWAWFLGMLVPVCGLVQVGAQLMANRYVYHPIVGLAIAVVFGAASVIPPHRARIAVLAFGLLCAMLAWRTNVELGYWRSSDALLLRAIEVTGSNCGAETQAGVALRDRGDVAAAARHWQRAVEECPEAGEAHSHLGAWLASQGDLDGAIPHFAIAAELVPELAADMRYNLGLALSYKGRREDALRELRRAVALDPKHAPALARIRRLEMNEP